MGKSHWVVSSTVKELNGVQYSYRGGEAELDTDSYAKPVVKLEIGGHMFTLEHLHLPHGMEHEISSKTYYVGAIQSKNLLASDGDVSRSYDGPDLIGRVALLNMEVVFQMPTDQPHTISWRRKRSDFTAKPYHQVN
ncbi:hypothetical protein C8F04DRAFT_1193101 [Mycena alexandri]|uniref:Uncharacterized protein n=1 Tax=Mycena alexandri TaxID=1745969 RepID=A0AAD6SA97_9AGAR|nr:hypothetical protein C8F04DRAFT_1193101 [Mycena alexandri]